MSRHRKAKYEYESPGCCYQQMYGGMGYGSGMGFGGGTGYGGGGSGAGWGIRWIYALLILIVIVLQFGRNQFPYSNYRMPSGCGGDGEIAVAALGGFGGYKPGQLIDNSVLFIIVVFLLILCTGCWSGGFGGAGAGYGTGGGCGSF